MPPTGNAVQVGDRTIKVTNLDKIMYPATGTTKGDVIAYYAAVAPTFVSHARGRPATRKRWVNGVGTDAEPGSSFFNKNLDPRSTPEWVRTFTIEHKSDANTYPLIDEPATLVWLAQLAALEIHVPQWRVGDDDVPRRPDRLVLDLDPGPGAGMAECVTLALLLRDILDGMSLTSVPVTSGSKGLHVYAGLDGTLAADEVSTLARELAVNLEAVHPTLVVSNMKKDLRHGKVLVDWSQNSASKTTIAPYSLRGRLHPTVAVPRSWDELAPDLPQLELDQVIERLAEVGDPLAVLTSRSEFVAPASDAAADSVAAGSEPHLAEVVTLAGNRLGQSGRTDPATETAAVAQPTAAEAPASEPVRRTPPRRTSAADLPVIEPMLASPAEVKDVRRGDWEFEVKWDGYRAVASVAGGEALYRSRRGIDFTATYPELAELAGLVGDHEVVLDGEIIAMDAQGRSTFELLQTHSSGAAAAHYMVFDLLHLDGRSLVRDPYLERRAALENLLGEGGRFVRVPTTFGDDAELALTTSRQLGLEGVIAKRPTSVYQPGKRAQTWLKIKHRYTQDVVIVGWTPSETSAARVLGALIIAVNDGDRLTFVGKVGSGFTDQALADAREVLDTIGRSDPPLDDVPAADARVAHWVEPLLVGEVEFGEWTDTGRLRHPVWRGWRPDRHAEEVVRDGGPGADDDDD